MAKDCYPRFLRSPAYKDLVQQAKQGTKNQEKKVWMCKASRWSITRGQLHGWGSERGMANRCCIRELQADAPRERGGRRMDSVCAPWKERREGEDRGSAFSVWMQPENRKLKVTDNQTGEQQKADFTVVVVVVVTCRVPLSKSYTVSQNFYIIFIFFCKIADFLQNWKNL